MKIKKGFVFVYYCFDVADNISIESIHKILGKKGESCIISSSRIDSDFVQYSKSPLFFKLGSFSTKKFGKITVDAKVYDFGVISLRLSLPFSGATSELEKASRSIIYEGVLEEEARKYMRRIKKELSQTMTNPREHSEPFESYCIFYVMEFEKERSVQNLLNRHQKDIARIIKPDLRQLSNTEIKESIQNNLSYYADDLVIIDFNASFIYDKNLTFDILDVLEFAVINSLELTYYDSVLDKSLESSHEDISNLKRQNMIFSINPYGKTLQNLLQVKLDVSDVIDKMSNSLKLIGELYLAKVFSKATKIFYLNAWKASIKSKLKTITSTYEMLSSRQTNRQMVILETAIVLLFILDIILLFAGL